MLAATAKEIKVEGRKEDSDDKEMASDIVEAALAAGDSKREGGGLPAPVLIIKGDLNIGKRKENTKNGVKLRSYVYSASHSSREERGQEGSRRSGDAEDGAW